MKQDINKLMEEARVAVKQASHKIADAHAEASVDKHPAREAIGHLRDLQEALYGLALYAAAQVRTHTESLSQVMERTQAKKCFVVPTRERMAQEDIALQAFQQQYCVPKQGVRSAETLAAPAGKEGRVPMTEADRKVEAALQTDCANNPDYEWVWDAPPGPPEWTPLAGKVHKLSNGNVAYLFDAGPDRRNLERKVAKRTLALVNKFGKQVRKKRIEQLREGAKRWAGKDAVLVHKTCPSWGETQCGTSLYTSCPSVTSTFYWKGVTCKECLKLRGVRMPRDKGIKQAVRAAKRKLFSKEPDNGDVPHRWMEPPPNHPNRFYLLVNGSIKRNPKGNGYFTIGQARRLQKKMKQTRGAVLVSETYLRK